MSLERAQGRSRDDGSFEIDEQTAKEGSQIVFVAHLEGELFESRLYAGHNHSKVRKSQKSQKIFHHGAQLQLNTNNYPNQRVLALKTLTR